MGSMLPLLISALRSLVEVAGLCLLGQGALFVLAGSTRERNPVYRIFCVVTNPVVKVVRMAVPKGGGDRPVAILTFFLLFGLWIALAYLRRQICLGEGLSC